MNSIFAGAINPAIDVWLLIEEDQEEASHEANTYRLKDGTFRVEWYNNAVGLVTPRHFSTYEEACVWLEENGYQDFTVND